MKKISKEKKLIAHLKDGPYTFQELIEYTGLSNGSMNNYLKYYLKKKKGLDVKIDASQGVAKYYIENQEE